MLFSNSFWQFYLHLARNMGSQHLPKIQYILSFMWMMVFLMAQGEASKEKLEQPCIKPNQYLNISNLEPKCASRFSNPRVPQYLASLFAFPKVRPTEDQWPASESVPRVNRPKRQGPEPHTTESVTSTHHQGKEGDHDRETESQQQRVGHPSKPEGRSRHPWENGKSTTKSPSRNP
jgi:hypothetical protein